MGRAKKAESWMVREREKFAARLGVSDEMWRLTLVGKRNLGGEKADLAAKLLATEMEMVSTPGSVIFRFNEYQKIRTQVWRKYLLQVGKGQG